MSKLQEDRGTNAIVSRYQIICFQVTLHQLGTTNNPRNLIETPSYLSRLVRDHYFNECEEI